MAQQQLRKENKTDERGIHVEKDSVPKMASHFESLTVKDSGDQPVTQHATKTMHGAAGGIHDQTEAKDQSLEKGQQTGQQAKGVVAKKTTGITDKAVDVSKKGASYIGEKAMESGKYVGKVAGVVKDNAVVGGWSAAEFVSDKAVGATETVANVTSGISGFAGNTVVATKDVLLDVGKKTKDMLVSTEERTKDYAARKKAEKQRELEAKNSKGER